MNDFASYDGLPYRSLQWDNANRQPDFNPNWWEELEPATWKGCVLGRTEDMTDTVPSSAPFSAQFWPSTLPYYGGSGDNDWYWANIDGFNDAENDGLGLNLGCGPEVTPLIAEQSSAHAAIDEMQPWHRGGMMASQSRAGVELADAVTRLAWIAGRRFAA